VCVCLPVTSAVKEVKVNVTSVVGDTVTLPCQSTVNSDVDWRHKDTPTSGVYYVYTNGVVYDIYQQRFSVNRRPRQGQYGLVISPLELNDSGLYICIGNRGISNESIVYQLTVIEGAYSLSFTYLIIEIVSTGNIVHN